MAAVEEAVRHVNSSAEVRHTSYSEISPDWVLDSDSYSLSHMKDLPMLKSQEQNNGHAHDHDHGHDHTKGDCEHCSADVVQPHSASTLSTHSFLISGLMDLSKLKVFLDRLLYSFDDGTNTHNNETNVGVGEKRALENLPQPPSSDKVSSELGTEITDECRIYRMKGVFQVAETSENGDVRPVLYLLQAVHDVFDIEKSNVAPGSADDRSEGLNKIIVIGKHMNKSHLETEFCQCLA